MSLGWSSQKKCFGVQTHLALSCKGLLPILGMGHVRVNVDKPGSGRPLHKASRFLTKQPGGVSHLEVSGRSANVERECFGSRHLINLRCAHAPTWCWYVHGCGPCPCFAMAIYHAGGTGANAAVRFRSLLTNLRELTLDNVAISLPALQPVAPQLRELDIFGSCLQGSAAGFLTEGWTALTSLRLTHTHMESATLTAALELPALEELDITGFEHQGGVLQLDQLTGSCPNIRGLVFEFSSSMARGREGRGPCSLLKLGQLADLCILTEFDPVPADLDFDLPASLAEFTLEAVGNHVADLFWVLREAVRCIRGGAQLRTLSCHQADAPLQPARWGASLDEQYRRLGGQLSTLRELEVWGSTEDLLRALGAVVSSAPHLSCVKVTITEWLPRMELYPISSASLQSITVTIDEPSSHCDTTPPPPVVLAFLPGCTRLQHVCVHFVGDLVESTAVKIRCHPCSPSSILPVDVHARAADRWCHSCGHGDACCVTEVGVQFLPGPPSPPGVQGYTVLCECHAIGPQQPLVWDHAVMPGLL